MLLVDFDDLGRVFRQTSPDRGRRWGVRENLDLLLVAGKP